MVFLKFVSFAVSSLIFGSFFWNGESYLVFFREDVSFIVGLDLFGGSFLMVLGEWKDPSFRFIGAVDL